MHRSATARYPSPVGVRLLALLAAAAPPALGLFAAGLEAYTWIPPVVAVALGLPLLVLRRRAATMIVLGVGMAALAGVLALQARGLFATLQDDDGSGWPTHDLTQAPFPESTHDFVEVRGYFRDEWTLNEYGTPRGQRPDLNAPARAILVPVTGSHDPTILLRGRIVIARVPAGRETTEGLQTIRGKARVPGAAARGVLLDALQVPDPHDTWIRGGLALLCTVIALACLWVAAAPGSQSQGRTRRR